MLSSRLMKRITYFSEINQALFLLKPYFFPTKPYLKVIKQGFNSQKMHIIWVKSCASFGMKDVHLLF